MRHIFICRKCSRFTMLEQCSCGCEAITAKPPKYSPDDKYASYRREAKRELLKKEEEGIA